jgi:hypothetical protein
MDKQQGILAAVLGAVVVAGLAFWWTTQEASAPADLAAPASSTAAPMTSTLSAPLATGTTTPDAIPAAASDALALGEELVDQVKKEGEELASRANDLEAQIKDGEALIALKEKQIRDLETELNKTAAQKPASR